MQECPAGRVSNFTATMVVPSLSGRSCAGAVLAAVLLVGSSLAAKHCSDTATIQQWGACTHYEILDVEVSASAVQIRRAYRGKALRWHPDKNAPGDAEAASRFIRVIDAYDTLSDSGHSAVRTMMGSATATLAQAVRVSTSLPMRTRTLIPVAIADGKRKPRIGAIEPSPLCGVAATPPDTLSSEFLCSTGAVGPGGAEAALTLGARRRSDRRPGRWQRSCVA